MTPEIVALAIGVVIGAVVVLGAFALRGRTARPGASREPARPSERRASDDAAGSSELIRLADRAGLALLELDDGLVVRNATAPAAKLLRRNGRLAGLSAIEVFADHRAEDLVSAARRDGAADGEMRIAQDPDARVSLRARRSADNGVLVVLEDRSELRRLQQVRTDFVDNVSHELRTPLTNVRLLVETLGLELDGASVEPAIRERIDDIDRETAHLVELVNDLLDLSRLEQGAAPLRLQLVEIAPVVESAVARMRLFAERQGVSVRTDLPHDLRPVRGDPERLSQLLLNLLHNAVKFSSASSTVTVSARAEGNQVVMSVTDQGAGIPRADLERVFERFYKVDRARTRSAGGTGLGLAIARHIAEAHDGRIGVESEEGRGSTFIVSLPAAN